MERFRYDRSSKWLLEHHGDSILRLAGIDDVVAWRPLPAEVVQPRQLPDGLLEVKRRGQPNRSLYLIETYADRRVGEQILDDIMLIAQARRVVPEVVLLVLRPKGQGQVMGQAEAASPSGRTRIWGSWPVVELWKVPAEPMLELGDAGIVPWIPLMETGRPPEQLLKECRAVIDASAKPEEVGNILAVSQVLASLRYDDQWLFNFFGGKEAMIESPYLKEIIDEQVALGVAKEVAKARAMQLQHDIPRILRCRFGAVPAEINASLEKMSDGAALDALADWAETCPDLAAFQHRLPK